jgi:hypothetical protein
LRIAFPVLLCLNRHSENRIIAVSNAEGILRLKAVALNPTMAPTDNKTCTRLKGMNP